jgi:predicted ArsR family transcriptional regulator
LNAKIETKNTRDVIIRLLQERGELSVNEIAGEVGINPISVRHHLDILLAEGLISFREERHGVGRPRMVYNLTEKGLDSFPGRYTRLTNRLLDELKQSLPAPFVDRLFTQMAVDVADQRAADMQGKPLDAKLDALKEMLADEGFNVDWQAQDDGVYIREFACPYYHIGRAHPEVCTVDQTMISRVLSIPVEKIECVLGGDAHCTYVITKADLEQATQKVETS